MYVEAKSVVVCTLDVWIVTGMSLWQGGSRLTVAVVPGRGSMQLQKV
jgi:hypothetical protein